VHIRHDYNIMTTASMTAYVPLVVTPQDNRMHNTTIQSKNKK